MKILLVIVLSIILSLGIMSFTAKKPNNLGVHDNRLLPPPSSPNCVSSFTDTNDAEHYIEPEPLDKSVQDKKAQIKEVLATWPRTKIITETDNYIHAECTSLLFRFTDDLEILIDEENEKVHFRSASRVGHSDLGANRKRVIKLKSQL